MQTRSTHPLSWAAFLGRAAGVAVCLLVLQQCSKPTGGTTGPSPNPPTQQPPTTPTPTPTVPGPQTLVGAGDIAICDGSEDAKNAEATARLLDGIGGTVFTLGDNAYPNGSRENYQCYNGTWGRHKDRTRPSLGNHDYVDSAVAKPYFEYFGTNAGAAGQGYYSYDLGGWHILVLNSGDTSLVASGVQDAWIRQDLAANATTKCTLAYWHHPLFSSGRNGSIGYVHSMYKLLYDANVDVVLNGHDHSYERFAEQSPDGRREDHRGIREFVVGTGGFHFYNFLTTLPNSQKQVTGQGSTGVLKMILSADSYTWEFITTGMGVQDSGAWPCH